MCNPTYINWKLNTDGTFYKDYYFNFSVFGLLKNPQNNNNEFTMRSL